MSGAGRFLTVCLNPTLQKTLLLGTLREDSVNRCAEHSLDASGKGINVSRVLVQLGERVIHLTHAGGWNRAIFLELCAGDRIDVRWIDSGGDVRFCYTLLSARMRTTTEIVEEAGAIAKGVEEKVYAEYLSLLGAAHTVVISGTKASGYSDSCYPRMVKAAKEAGKLVILDIRGEDLLESLEHRPDIIKPNYEELVATFFPCESQDEEHPVPEERLASKMVELYETYRITSVITHGSEACLYVDKGKIKRAMPGKIIPVNVTGCGDAFCAGLAQRFVATGDIECAIANAVECAAKNALQMRPGVIAGE
jgi:1-phosphofructokinase family hexose kinase